MHAPGRPWPNKIGAWHHEPLESSVMQRYRYKANFDGVMAAGTKAAKPPLPVVHQRNCAHAATEQKSSRHTAEAIDDTGRDLDTPKDRPEIIGQDQAKDFAE